MRMFGTQRAVILIAVLAASACSGPPMPPPSTTVLPEPELTRPDPFAGLSPATDVEYAPYRVAGTAVITGQAFLTTRGGDVKRAAGRQVILDPATPYATRWWQRVGIDTERFVLTPPDARYQNARRTTTADADGRFRFTGLAPGTYIVRTVVTWEAPGSGLQGGVVGAEAKIGAGETKDVIVSTLAMP